MPETPDQDPSFDELAQRHRSSLLRELLGYLSENKKWWLLPILITLFLISALVLLSGTAAAPFIYTLF